MGVWPDDEALGAPAHGARSGPLVNPRSGATLVASEGMGGGGGCVMPEQRDALVRRLSQRVAHLLAEDERVINAGSATWLEWSERLGRGSGEGVLVVTSQHVRFGFDAFADSIAIPLGDVTDYVLEVGHATPSSLLPGH